MLQVYVSPPFSPELSVEDRGDVSGCEWHSVTHHSLFSDPSGKMGSHPHFLVKLPLFLSLLTCVVSQPAKDPHTPLPAPLGTKFYRIQMSSDGNRFPRVSLVVFQKWALVSVLCLGSFTPTLSKGFYMHRAVRSQTRVELGNSSCGHLGTPCVLIALITIWVSVCY